MNLSRRACLQGSLALPLTFGAVRASEPLPVLASFSILADLTREVGGDRVRVDSLVGPGQDAHVFEPSPADARRVAAARAIVVVGLGFDPWLDRLARAAHFRGQRILASEGIRTLKARPHKHGHDHGHGHHHHHHGDADPHIWQDPKRVQVMVRRIAAGLGNVDPAGRAGYEANAARYSERLEALHAWVERELAPIPREGRRIVTSHDAFAYFGERYGVTFLAPQGVTSRGEPSAQQIAALVQQIRRERIRALFLEGQANPRILEQVAREAGVRIGGTLYADALSPPDGPAPTYEALIRHNTRMIVEALAG